MYNLNDLKLELSVNKKINRMDLVKARAEMRTKRRIAEQLEKKAMKELEEQVAQRNSDARNEVTVDLASPSVEPQDEYTATETANGNTQYRKNGKLISKAEYEAQVGN